MSLAELSSEYGIAKSTINGWIKDVKEIKSTREVENEDLKVAIIRIYKANKVYMELLEFTIYLLQKALMYFGREFNQRWLVLFSFSAQISQNSAY